MWRKWEFEPEDERFGERERRYWVKVNLNGAAGENKSGT